MANIYNLKFHINMVIGVSLFPRASVKEVSTLSQNVVNFTEIQEGSNQGTPSLLPGDGDQGVGVPIFGLPGPVFYVIHITAMVSLTISITSSTGVLTYLTCTAKQPFIRRPIGERVVIYLALCDLLFSVTHMVDHAFMMALLDFPPDAVCQMASFFMQEFMMAQAIVVTFTAFSAFVLVVKERRLPVGRYDWRLLLASLGIPFIPVSVQAAFGYLGPSGGWCMVDMSKPYGPLLTNIISIATILAFAINLVCYLLVWLKMNQVSKAMVNMDANTAENHRKYHRAAKIMMLFVAVYIGQWWAYATYCLWTFFGAPHISIAVAAVFFTNMGGAFNFLAYTLVRRVWKQKDEGAGSRSNTNSSTATLYKPNSTDNNHM